MSSITRIKEHYDNFTEVDKKIADYILANVDDVLSFTVKELATKSNTSPAAVIRFVKKIGYSGYPEMKVELAKTDTHSKKILKEDDFDNIIRESDDLVTIALKLKNDYFINLSKTFALMNYRDLEEAVKLISQARRVYIYGLGGSSIVGEDFYQKLIRIDIDAHFIKDYHLFLSALTHLTEEDVLLSLSYSGETHEVIKAQRFAFDRGIKTIAVTQSGKNTINRYSNVVLSVGKKEQELRLGFMAPRNSMFAITDLLYLGVASEHQELVRENIIKTRKSIRNLE